MATVSLPSMYNDETQFVLLLPALQLRDGFFGLSEVFLELTESQLQRLSFGQFNRQVFDDCGMDMTLV